MATQAGLAGSDAVYERALQLLKRSGTPDDLRRSVVVEPSADLASLTIRATSGDPAEAANLANAVGTAYQQVAGERSRRGAATTRSRDCSRSWPSGRPSSTPSERRSRSRPVPIGPPSSDRRCTWPI